MESEPIYYAELPEELLIIRAYRIRVLLVISYREIDWEKFIDIGVGNSLNWYNVSVFMIWEFLNLLSVVIIAIT